MNDHGGHVFISYCTKNKGAATSLAKALEGSLPCWFAERDIPATSDWQSEIVKAIEVCSVLVLVLTAEANRSRDVRKEVLLADQLHKPILRINIGKFKLSRSLTYQLSGIQYLSWSHFKHVDFNKIKRVVEQRQSQRPIAEAEGPTAEIAQDQPEQQELWFEESIGVSSAHRPNLRPRHRPQSTSRPAGIVSERQRGNATRVSVVFQQFRDVPGDLRIFAARFLKRVDPDTWQGRKDFALVEKKFLSTVDNVADVLRRLLKAELQIATKLRLDIMTDIEDAFRATNASLLAIRPDSRDEKADRLLEQNIFDFEKLARRYRAQIRRIYRLRNYALTSALTFGFAATLGGLAWSVAANWAWSSSVLDISFWPRLEDREKYTRFGFSSSWKIVAALVLVAFSIGMARPQRWIRRVLFVVIGAIGATLILRWNTLGPFYFHMKDPTAVWDSLTSAYGNMTSAFTDSDKQNQIIRAFASVGVVAGILFLIKDIRSAHRPAWWKLGVYWIGALGAIFVTHFVLEQLFATTSKGQGRNGLASLRTPIILTRAALTSCLVIAVSLVLKAPWISWGLDKQRRAFKAQC
ncbi:MAG: toll/interleukin-1 receptor domain-containing protein [Planctomycetota bacterium]